MYKSQCLREGDKPLPEATIEYYLKNSKAFMFETKKESFKKIDPKTGHQESQMGIVNGVEQSIGKKRTSTTAFVFDYKMLNISVENGDPDGDQDPAEENKPVEKPVPTPAATQQQVKFENKNVESDDEDELPF
jgi:hypothetical protein